MIDMPKVWNPRKGNRIGRRAKQECVEQPTQLVNEEYVYRFHLLPEWANTIRLIREKLALRRDSPHLSDEFNIKTDVLDITCKNEDGKSIVLHFRMQDVYLIGFTVGGVIYEFKPDNGVNIFPISKLLSYGPGYHDMDAGEKTSITIGYASLTQAFREMIRDTRSVGERTWMGCIKNHIPRVLVMLPECVRFKWHYLYVSQLMTVDKQWADNLTVTDWMAHGINHWKDASDVAFEKVRTNRKIPPPSGKTRKYDQAAVEKALEDWVWATDLLCVHCLRKREPLHVLKKVGKYLLVLWNNKDVEWQTQSDMNHDFPYFNKSIVDFPNPPQPPA